MRKIAFLLSAAALCLLLAGCGGQEAALRAEDVALTVRGETVTADSSVDALLDLFGADYDYAEAISCIYTGMEKTYQYPDCILYTYPGEQGDCLLEIYCTADAASVKGPGIGSSRAEVEAAYGSGYTQAGDVMTYTLDSADTQMEPATIYFELQDDTVCAVGLTAEHRAE